MGELDFALSVVRRQHGYLSKAKIKFWLSFIRSILGN